jgi:polyphosphate glucokinase
MDEQTGAEPRTLAVDIGGTGLKMEVLDLRGQPLTERGRVPTPRPAKPAAVLAALAELIRQQGEFDRVSVGFPGVVIRGVVKTAPNLDPSWAGYDLDAALTRLTGKPVRVCNDADVQGFGDIDGDGVEMVLTLGTGVGSAVFVDGRLLPNLELGHQPFRKGKTYEDYVGKAALDKVGKKAWVKRVHKVVEQLEPIWNYRVLYLGGGNARLLEGSGLPENVKITPNAAGLLGGIALWAHDAPSTLDKDGESGTQKVAAKAHS